MNVRIYLRSEFHSQRTKHKQNLPGTLEDSHSTTQSIVMLLSIIFEGRVLLSYRGFVIISFMLHDPPFFGGCSSVKVCQRCIYFPAFICPIQLGSFNHKTLAPYTPHTKHTYVDLDSGFWILDSLKVAKSSLKV